MDSGGGTELCRLRINCVLARVFLGNAVDVQPLVEALGSVHRVLAGHGVHPPEGFVEELIPRTGWKH